MTVDTRFEVYRFDNRNGTTKDWAIRDNEDGTYTKLWGRTGTRLQSKIFQKKDWRALDREKMEKTEKGYFYVGLFILGDDGKLAEMPSSQKPVLEVKPMLYWRIKASTGVSNENLEYFRAQAARFVELIVPVFPSEWAIALKSRYRDLRYVTSEAGQLEKSAGVGTLLLLMGLKKSAPEGLAVYLTHEDQVEISYNIKMETEALRFFDSDLESVRQVAEMLGLIDKRLDIANIESAVGNLYF